MYISIIYTFWQFVIAVKVSHKPTVYLVDNWSVLPLLSVATWSVWSCSLSGGLYRGGSGIHIPSDPNYWCIKFQVCLTIKSFPWKGMNELFDKEVTFHASVVEGFNRLGDVPFETSFSINPLSFAFFIINGIFIIFKLGNDQYLE